MKNYKIHSNGVIQQKEIVNKLQDYNIDYVADRYDSYGELSKRMAYLRYGFLKSICKDVRSILDVGYGNGDFLEVCKKTIQRVGGNDITHYPLTKGVNFEYKPTDNYYDVICFFDSLEHFEDITFVKDLKCEYIYISVPLCHYDKLGPEWFMNWKHRREDEHLWHFDKNSLKHFMEDMGFEIIVYSDVEDVIRTPIDDNQNILTAIFKRK